MTRLRGLGAGIVRLGEAIVIAAALGLGAIGVIGPLTGHQVIAVTSGSMGPDIPDGALIFVSQTRQADVRVGDDITVQLPSGALLTHRIVATSVVDGQPTVTIRGEANDPASVEVVSADRIIGRVTAVASGGGRFLEQLTQPAAVAAWVGIVTIGFLRRLMRGARVRRGRLRPGRAFGFDPAGIAVALLLVFVVPFGANSIRDSAAIFTTSASVSGNTFSSGTWGGSDYRTAATGGWDSAATWERFNGTSWVSAIQAPTITDTVITIRSGHVVTVGTDRLIDQVVVDAGGQLTVSSGVTLTVTAGTGTDIDVAGLVSVDGTMTIGAGADVGIESGGTVDDGSAITGTGTITGSSGTLRAVGGSRTIGNPIALTAGLIVSGTADLSLTAVLSGTGTLTKTGTGTLTLSAANTYTGVTTISAGVVSVQNATSLGTTAGATTVASGAAINVDGTGLTIAEPITSLIGTGVSATGAVRNLANANTWSGAITLGGAASIGSDAGTITLAGVSATAQNLTVTGSGNTTVGGVIGTTTGTLTKTGTGTLTLSAANTYTGVTTISAGQMLVNGSTGAGVVTVASGATLGGAGTMTGTVTISGTLAPGSSAAGRLITAAATFSASSTLAIEIGGTTVVTGYDQYRISSGAVSIGSTVTLSLVAIGGFSPSSGQTFQIVDKVGAGAISGTFNGLAQGATISNFLGSGLNATISYVGGDGNDVVLTVQ